MPQEDSAHYRLLDLHSLFPGNSPGPDRTHLCWMLYFGRVVLTLMLLWLCLYTWGSSALCLHKKAFAHLQLPEGSHLSFGDSRGITGNVKGTEIHRHLHFQIGPASHCLFWSGALSSVCRAMEPPRPFFQIRDLGIWGKGNFTSHMSLVPPFSP